MLADHYGHDKLAEMLRQWGAGKTSEQVMGDVLGKKPAELDHEFRVFADQKLLRGEAYAKLVDEFVDAVREVFPGALIQWEDFRKDNALRILDRYRSHVLSFNDDIQGTGAVALAGVLSAMRASGAHLAEQRIIIHGAGAAGLGIYRQLREALVSSGVQQQAIPRHLAVLDSTGLLVSDRPARDEYKRAMAAEMTLRALRRATERALAYA